MNSEFLAPRAQLDSALVFSKIPLQSLGKYWQYEVLRMTHRIWHIIMQEPCYWLSLNNNNMTRPGKARCQGWIQWHFPSLTSGFTYSDLHREFHHKNKPQPTFWWCRWSLCLLDLPIPLWVQEPVPEKKKLNWIRSIMQYLFNKFGIHQKVHLTLTSIFKTSIMCFVMCCVCGRIIKHRSWQTYSEKQLWPYQSEEK